MRAAPPLQITIERFGQWRAAMSLVAALACASVLAWSASAGGDHRVLATGATMATLLMAAAAWLSAWRLQATSLRWDGQCWHWGPAATRGSEPLSGTLAVACDLGGWMLVRLADASVTGWRARGRYRWLPIQRAGHELHWHALRCTVYSPRPSPPTSLPLRKDPTPE